MGIKDNLHSLATSSVVTDEQAAALRKYSITSLEELLAALRSRRAGIASVLGIPDVEVDDLETKVSDALPTETVKRYEQPARTIKRGFGARIEPFKSG